MDTDSPTLRRWKRFAAALERLFAEREYGAAGTRLVLRAAVERTCRMRRIRLSPLDLDSLFPTPGLFSNIEKSRFSAEFDAAAERWTLPDDWRPSESVGWLYQFLVARRKRRNRQGVVDTANAAASTELFTPKWIADWLIARTLGRRLTAILSEMKKSKSGDSALERLEQTTLLDPSCGTGHILLAAYTLFETAYRKLGIPKDLIPRKILDKNLFGLDLDLEAVRLARTLLTLRGGESSGVFVNASRIFDFSDAPGGAIFGSLLRLDTSGDSDSAAANYADGFLPELPDSAEKTLRRRFDAVVTNPPYLGAKGVSRELKEYVRSAGYVAPPQLDGLFIEQGIRLARPEGAVGMITMQSWLFLPTFERLRRKILNETTLCELLHLGVGAFASISGEVVSTAAFALENSPPKKESRPVFWRLTDGGADVKRERFLTGTGRFAERTQADFSRFDAAPLVYWASKKVREFLYAAPKLAAFAEIKQGMATGDNRRFLRKRNEVAPEEIGLGMTSRAEAAASGKRWFPYSKGVGFRKWFAEIPDVIDWADDGRELFASRPKSGAVRSSGAVIRNPDYFFRPGLSWSFVSSGPFSARLIPGGVIFDVGASMLFPIPDAFPGLNEEDARFLLLGWLNSSAASGMMKMINPTMNYQVGDLARLPFALERIRPAAAAVIENVRQLVEIARRNAERFSVFTARTERSGEVESARDIQRTQTLEEMNNRLLLDALGLTGEFPIEVPLGEITLR